MSLIYWTSTVGCQAQAATATVIAQIESESLNKARKRFTLWFFAVGTLVPIIFVPIGFLLPLGGDLNGIPAKVFVVLGLAIWPTCILMMDAEHADQIAAMLAIAAPLNGLWYAVIGRLVWFFRQKRKTRLQ